LAVVQGWHAVAVVAMAAMATEVAARPGEPPAPRELVSIASVMAAPLLDTARPVRIRGIVTWRRGNGMIVQDDSAGIWIEVADARRAGYWQAQGDPSPDIREGVEIEIEGWSNQGGYAPNILPDTMRILGEKPQPQPRAYDPERFFQGVDDCLRVTARGVVQGFRDDGDRWLLLVVEGGRRFTVAIDKQRLGGSPEDYVDSVITCVGVATAQFNTRGQFLSPRLNLTAASDLTIEQAPLATAFETPQVALRALGGYRPDSPDGHRICTRGVVTHAVPGRFLYLQDGCLGVRVQKRRRGSGISRGMSSMSPVLSTAAGMWPRSPSHWCGRSPTPRRLCRCRSSRPRSRRSMPWRRSVSPWLGPATTMAASCSFQRV
jgi:hypothetical protein